jgi:hypothetical protein
MDRRSGRIPASRRAARDRSRLHRRVRSDAANRTWRGEADKTPLYTRLANEEGTALIIALMAMLLLTALAAAVVMVSSTEVKIAGNYNNGQETLYAADAAVERVVQDLLLIPRWNDILAGSVKSALIDGPDTTLKSVSGGTTILLCCAANSVTGQLQALTDTANLWDTNNPKWKLFAYAPLKDMLPDVEIDSASYIAVWVADDPADSIDGVNPDGDPLVDSNGTLTLHAKPSGRPARTRSSR